MEAAEAGYVVLIVAYTIGAVGAGLFFLARKQSRQSRFLGWFLLAEGLGHSGLATFIAVLAESESRLYWSAITLGGYGAVLSSVLYLIFLGAAMPSPLTRWLNWRGTNWILGAILLIFLLLHFIPRELPFYHPNATSIFSTIAWPVVGILPLISPIFGLLVAVQALRLAKPGLQRRRATAFVSSFAARDFILILAFGGSYLDTLFGWGMFNFDSPFGGILYTYGFTGFHVVFIVLLIYGTLSGQIIALDQKVHFTVNKTTIAAIFVAVFIGVQTAVSEFVAGVWGWAAAGISAAALFVALNPLQTLAERFADKAVPHGRASSKMTRQEREEFYAEQVEIAYSDGMLGAKERRALQNVRERMGLSSSVALGIEDSIAAD